MIKIKSKLPLLTCLIHGQMRPPLALTSKDKRGLFPRLKVRMEQLLQNPEIGIIDKWYMEILPQFTNIQYEEDEHVAASLDLLKLLDDKKQGFSDDLIPDKMPTLEIDVNVPNDFAERFYDCALKLESCRTWQWLKEQKEQLCNDESFLQVVRNTLSTLNQFSRECVLRQAKAESECNEIIMLRIMQLYFAIEYTYCKRDDWRQYLEDVCKLPLTLDEYCFQLWERCPENCWREAYERLSSSEDVNDTTPDLPQFTERPKLTTAAEKFVKFVAPFCFEELQLVKELTPKQQTELIELIVKDACYAAAMLKYLGYYDRLKDKYQMSSDSKVYSHCAKAVGCAESSFKKYYYSLRTKDPYSTYERHNSQVFFDNGQIEADYRKIKELK